MEKKRVLAMYDVRGKQKYIYRSNHIKEMIGASCIIRDVFKDYLYDAAKVVRNRTADLANQEAIYNYKDAETEEIPQFSLKEFEGRMSGQQYIGEVVYDGGGNFFVLYQDKEICREINKIFTKELMKKTYALKVLCTFIEDLNYRQYREDNIRLYQKHRINEAQESVIYPVNSIPIVQTDYLTSRPLSVTARTTYAKGSKPEKLSLESYAKYLKYEEEAAENEDVVGEKVLDRIITEKGKESLLAVIYIDGNNMGVQVQNCLKGKSSYEECVNALRKFSNQIQKIYVDNRIQAINGMLDKKYEKECHKKRRTIVLAGDEMTIICNARDVMEVVKAYFKDLPRGCSSCAGIAIFHSHAPYADAYRLAEECCEEGKSRMKKDHLWNADFVDFHYCQGEWETR